MFKEIKPIYISEGRYSFKSFTIIDTCFSTEAELPYAISSYTNCNIGLAICAEYKKRNLNYHKQMVRFINWVNYTHKGGFAPSFFMNWMDNQSNKIIISRKRIEDYLEKLKHCN